MANPPLHPTSRVLGHSQRCRFTIMCGRSMNSLPSTWASRICAPLLVGLWEGPRPSSGQRSILTSWILWSPFARLRKLHCTTRSSLRGSKAPWLRWRRADLRDRERLVSIEKRPKHMLGRLKRRILASRHWAVCMLDGKKLRVDLWLLFPIWHIGNRGFSQAFYRHKLYETALNFKGLEDFMVNFWEKWACSKGAVWSQWTLYQRTDKCLKRTRKSASLAPNLANWWCLAARAI